MSSEASPDSVPSDGKPHGKRNRGHNRRNAGIARAPTRFEGGTPELKGFVYDCVPDRQADQYVQTTRKLAEHFVRSNNNSGPFRNAILRLELPTIPPVPRPTAHADGSPPDKYDDMEFTEALKERNHKNREIENLNMSLYSLVWSQCSDAMRERLGGLADYDVLDSESDGIALLKAVKNASYSYIDKTYKVESANVALIRLVTCRQSSYQTVQEYFNLFKTRRDVHEQVGGNTQPSPAALQILADDLGLEVDDLTDAHHKAARDRDLAQLFINNADRNRFGEYQASLRNDYLGGDDKYPTTLNDAYSMLAFRVQSPNRPVSTNSNDGVAFVTNTAEDTDNDGVTLANNGNQNNNTSNKGKHHRGKFHNTNTSRPENKDDDVEKGDNNKNSNANVNSYPAIVPSHTFNMSSTLIPRSWILLDNQSTVDIFCEASLLDDIHESSDTMTIQCNAGTITTTTKAQFGTYGTVWYCKSGIANILSFANALNNGCNIHYDADKNTFILQQQQGGKLIFQQSPGGLYYYDTQFNSSIALVNTVESNKAKYSHRDFLRAQTARDLMCKIGRPSLQQFLTILDKNQLPNCPVTRRDALIAEKIFGPDIGSLKGKTVHRPPESVQIQLNDLPIDIMTEYQQVTLCGDIMFINKIPFFITISRHIHFGTVEMIANRQMDTILKSIKAVTAIYQQRGFQVTHLLLDGEFEPLRGALAGLGIQMNLVANDEHVPEAERFIRTLKERTRCIYNTLPFAHLPPRIVIEMVKTANFWMNVFPYHQGISDVLSPRQIITGSTIDYNRHCNLSFGTYVQTHEAHDNSMVPRTTGAIALRPTGNAQGGFYFYSLSSGRVISRNRWTELPMPNEVIDRIHFLARRAHAAQGPLAFNNRFGLPYDDTQNNANDSDADDDDDDDDGTYHPPPHDNNDDDDDNDDDSADSHEYFLPLPPPPCRS